MDWWSFKYDKMNKFLKSLKNAEPGNFKIYIFK